MEPHRPAAEPGIKGRSETKAQSGTGKRSGGTSDPAGSQKSEKSGPAPQVRSVDRVLGTRQSVQTVLALSHKKNDCEIIVPLELMRRARDVQRIFTRVLGSIAAISLLVGGIGIMNIMMATVSERTREIGIRRALGARKRDIVVQFLSETLLLTLFGGLVGIVVGSAIPFGVSYFGHMRTLITPGSLVLAFGISSAVGLIFGLYPAYRAANMDPIESLRHE